MKVLAWNSLLLVCLLAVTTAMTSVAQAADYLLVIDSSGSMGAKTADGMKKIDAAKKALTGLRSDLAAHDVGVLLFGHRTNAKAAGCCQDMEMVLPIAPMSSDSFGQVVSRLTPRGSTPLAASLQQASQVLKSRDQQTEKYVIVVTDGTDTCGGDPVATAAALRNLGINVKIHVVGFGVNKKESVQLERIATQGGGEYRSATDLKGLVSALVTVIAVNEKPQPKPEATTPLSVVEKVLVKRLVDKNGYVRQQAADTLKKCKATATLSYLKRRAADDLSDGSWMKAKDAALNAVAAMAPHDVTPTLLIAVQSKNNNVRLWAVTRLATKGGPVAKNGVTATDAALIKCLIDKDGYVRQRAGNSLATRKALGAISSLAKRVSDDLSDGSWMKDKDAALAALKAMAPTQVEGALVKAMDSKNDNVRNWATARISSN
jgi:Mg-chelatase subunit ChlD